MHRVRSAYVPADLSELCGPGRHALLASLLLSEHAEKTLTLFQEVGNASCIERAT